MGVLIAHRGIEKSRAISQLDILEGQCRLNPGLKRGEADEELRILEPKATDEAIDIQTGGIDGAAVRPFPSVPFSMRFFCFSAKVSGCADSCHL